MDLKKKKINLCNTIKRNSTQVMTEGDVNVPDAKPDILKILQVDAESYITEKYIENEKLILCGKTEYKIIYVPDKENEKIKSILTSMDFKQTIDAEECETGDFILTEPIVDRIEFNIVNSRKLRLRAIIHVEYEICQINTIEVCSGVSDIENNNVECLKQICAYENTVDLSSHEFTLKETMEIPNGQSAVKEIVKTDIKISDTEHKTVTGKVIVKGNINICVLYVGNDNEIQFTETEIPFTEVLDADGVHEESICDIDFKVIGSMCEVETDTDGDLRILEFDIDIANTIRAVDITETDIVVDCFVPGFKTECKIEKVKINKPALRPKSQNTIREIIDIPSNAPAVNGIYNVMTNTIITKSDIKNNKLICEGKIEAYILYLTDSGDIPVYSLKKDIPFSYMIECQNTVGKENVELAAEIKHISYNLTSEGNLELRCLLTISGKLTQSIDLNNIISIETEEIEKENGIVIYFADNNTNIWDIAKKYSVAKSEIMNYNKLDSEILKGAHKLFIPM